MINIIAGKELSYDCGQKWKMTDTGRVQINNHVTQQRNVHVHIQLKAHKHVMVQHTYNEDPMVKTLINTIYLEEYRSH
jgi:hypothetical protein